MSFKVSISVIDESCVEACIVYGNRINNGITSVYTSVSIVNGVSCFSCLQWICLYGKTNNCWIVCSIAVSIITIITYVGNIVTITRTTSSNRNRIIYTARIYILLGDLIGCVISWRDYNSPVAIVLSREPLEFETKLGPVVSLRCFQYTIG